MQLTLITIIAGAASLITFFVTRQIFREDLKLGPLNLMAAAVAGLAFLGLAGRGEEHFATVILIPYEALAVTLLILFLWLWLAPRVTFPAERFRTPDEDGDCHAKPQGSRAPDQAPSGQTPKTWLSQSESHPPGTANHDTHESQGLSGDATRVRQNILTPRPRWCNPPDHTPEGGK